jgi:hypothetical protein
MRINTGCWVDGCKCFDTNDEDGVEIKRDREWVGLTNEEIKDILDCGRGGLVDIKKAEQKLKEKNGG